MNKRLVVAGVGLLVLAAAIAIASYGVPTPLKTGSLNPDAPPGSVGCYTSGVSGELLDDPGAGTAIIDSMDGRRVLVTWPIGWTARRALFGGTQVIDERGMVVARTGTRVYLMGGYWYVDNSFLTCGPAPVNQ
jgi:hypothetical protein